MRIAQQAEAASVISVLKASGMRRTEEKPSTIVAYSNAHPEVAISTTANGRNLSKHSPSTTVKPQIDGPTFQPPTSGVRPAKSNAA